MRELDIKKKKKLRELKKGRGRPKLTLMEQIKKDSSIKEVTDKAAYLVKNQLKKVSLKDSAVEFLIEYVLPLHLVPFATYLSSVTYVRIFYACTIWLKSMLIFDYVVSWYVIFVLYISVLVLKLDPRKDDHLCHSL